MIAFFSANVVVVLTILYIWSSTREEHVMKLHRHISAALSKVGLLPRSEENVSMTVTPGDPCFSSYQNLFKVDKLERKLVFRDLNPPMHVGQVPANCRPQFIPKPMPTSVTKALRQCFTHTYVNASNRRVVRDSLKIVKRLFDMNKIPLILSDGSLIGSWRNHGIIPYDDDFDFYVPRNEKTKIKAFLNDLCKRDKSFVCVLDRFHSTHFQLWIGFKNRTKRDFVSYIDFFFYDIKNEVISSPQCTTSAQVFFPLSKRPLEGDLYDSPRNISSFFKYCISGSVNLCNSYDHLGKQRKNCKPLPCSDLNTILPFKVTSEGTAGRLEMVVNGSYIQSIFYEPKL